MPLLRSALLCLSLTALSALASPMPREREGRSGPPAARPAEAEQPEWLGLGSVEASGVDGPGVIGLCTALVATFFYARRVRRSR
jgi:hypothetical protein